MITSFERNLTHICPDCGMVTTRSFSPFAFSGRNRLTVLCPNPLCQSACLTIFDKRSRYELSVECPMCGDVHDKVFRRAELWNNELLTVKCPETDIGICFIGERNALKRAVEKAQKDYAELNDQDIDYYEDYVPNNGDEALGAKIAYVSDILHYMSEEGTLSCRCGSHDITITLIDDKLRLRCARCGSMSTIEPTDEFLKSIASMDSYIFNK